MTDILSRCIKCKNSLCSVDRTSKLLPCLHTMCEDCISGRTDVAEKLKRLKEEKEHKPVATENDVKKDLEEGGDDAKPAVGEKEPTDSGTKEDTPASENLNGEKTESDSKCKSTSEQENQSVPDQTLAIDEQNEEKMDTSSGKNESDEQSIETKTENSKTHSEDTGAASSTGATASNPSQVSASTDDSEAKQETRNEQSVSNNADKGSEGEKNSVEENSVANQDKPTVATEDVNEVEETPPPVPVPLTECPVCREPFNPEALIENVFIRKQAAASEDGEGKEQKCTGCESNPATSYCLQCDDWLCSDCVNAHKRVRMTKDHQLSSLEEAMANKGGSAGPTEVSMLCRVHPKEKLTLFCEKCEVLTCRDCQLLQHQEHKYQFLQEAADSYKAKLTGSLSLMKDRRDVLRQYQTEIVERLNKVKREKNELQQDILRQADTIVKAVRASVWSVLSSLHSFTDAAAKRLSREVGDVGALVGKFDHCISFMDGILEDGFGLPLLFSKTIVETKCRKVYHTPMEPQSLKGQLNIQYRHEVPSVLRSLPHIGAIYVNGSKYPPEKSTPQSQSSSGATGSHAQSSSAYRSGSNTAGNAVVGSAAQSPGIASHMAPQERNLYMQMMMSRQSHANTAASQGSTLSLPGSRRLGSMGPGPRGWASQPLGLASNPGSLMAGMIGQSGQMMPTRAPAFTPMRLHHRPVDPSHMPAAPPMVLGGPHRPPHSSHAVGFNSLPAPPPLRSPSGQPQYRGAAEGILMNSGGQAAMSGIRRPGNLMNTSPDPARPASGGHNTPERPLSSEGAASSMRVKSEPMDSADCVITSASFKGKKSPVMPNSTLGEMQKNLDEVIRGVPLDLGDNLEQINGGDCSGISTSVKTTAPPPPLVSSPTRTATSVVVSSSSSSSKTNERSSVSPMTTASTTAVVSGEGKSAAESTGSGSGGDQSTHFETDGRQVEGYATGNSMPGFILSAVESGDPNDDYCAACHQGGDVLCCDKCPRVFHLQCHVPVLSTVPNGPFVCTLCEKDLIVETSEESLSPDSSGKRKVPVGLSDKNLKVCERLLLELFCHPSSIPFHEPVNRAVPNYYKIITSPMDFSTIKSKLSRSNFNHYSSVEGFLDDCKLVFKNCSIYNAETSDVGKAGKIVDLFFKRLVDRHVPYYGSYANRHHETLHPDTRHEPEPKRRRLSPSPHATAHGEKTNSSVVHVH